jgi:3-mercaptopyruvate sulfurtransferase SseA
MADFAHFDEIVACCGSGVTACAVIAAMEQSGMGSNIKLYSGGWSDGLTYPGFPKITF